jgi:uncharacterized membrane protein
VVASAGRSGSVGTRRHQSGNPRLLGIGARRRAVDVQKTITVDTPVEAVYAFWTMYDNFPRFMSRVLEVRPSARDIQSHWRMEGPGGVPIEFDAEIMQAVRNQVFAWRTVEGSIVGHAGLVHFEPTSDGRCGYGEVHSAVADCEDHVKSVSRLRLRDG